MKKTAIRICSFSLFVLLTAVPSFAGNTAAELNRDANYALEKLFADSKAADNIASVAKGILVFPNVIKGGFMVGGQYGEGVLRVGEATRGYYNTVAASFGLQAGAQSFGYAMFFMSDEALEYLNKSSGWEVGVGPSVVIVDEGLAKSLTTTTAQDDVYVFFFSQQGLMAGLGVQGSKISPITPE